MWPCLPSLVAAQPHPQELLPSLWCHEKKPISRMTATYQSSQYPADQLWSSEADCPTLLCDTCEQWEYDICHMTGMQLACTHCRVGKTGCSYSPFCKACCVEMMWSSKLPQAGSSKAVEENVKTEKMTRLGIEPRPSWTYTSSSNQLSYQVLLGSSW